LEDVRSSDSIGLRLPDQALFVTVMFLARERVPSIDAPPGVSHALSRRT
jgi:hypothetical protein